MSLFNKNYPDKCGWVCRRLHDLKDVVSAVSPIVGSIINTALKSYNLENFAFRTVNLTTEETMFLDSWYKSKFEPFSIEISILYQRFLESNDLTIKINLLNEINSQLCLVASYYDLINLKTSTNVKKEIKTLIEDFSNLILKDLAFKTSSMNIAYENKVLNFKYINPIVTTEISGFSNYVCQQWFVRKPKPINIISPDLTLNDNSSTIIKDELFEAVNNVEEGNNVKDNTNIVATEMQPKKVIPWWVYVLGVYGLYKLLK